MALRVEIETIPGTEQLIDVGKSQDTPRARGKDSDILLIPNPSPCTGDPLNWPAWKKNYQLFLLALYACAFSFGENTLGAAWTTISEETGVTLTNMNGGSALNYLLLGFANVWWMPTANVIGRRFVFLATLCLCLSTSVWLGSFHGTAQWMANMVVNGIGTSAYQAIIQLSIFDTFFAHQRGQSLAFYLFGQQLGSILGLITGGVMADTVGWRWSQYICGIIFAVVLILFVFTFEETLSPRFLFPNTDALVNLSAPSPPQTSQLGKGYDGGQSKTVPQFHRSQSCSDGFVDEFPKRTYVQMLKPCTRYPQNRTTFWQYFRRPFFLFSFPNIVIPGFIFAFGCTAGIVSFNTLSEIFTSAPYNFDNTTTGLMFLAALVGDFIGWGIGVLSDKLVILLARRNGGVKEPEMRLYMLIPCFVFAGAGYMLYGWGAQTGAHWIVIAIGICAMISHQVGACTIATTYAMECFPGISSSLVVVLAVCSSLINFAMSYSVQPLIDAVGFGYAFVFFGICVLSSVVAAIPLLMFGKKWRVKKAPRYYKFLEEANGEIN